MDENIKRAVFLDFDGVLFDTVKEAYCVCMIAMGKASGISGVNLDSPYFHEFHRYRFLIGPAWNYYYLVPLIDEKIDYPSLDVENAYHKAIRSPALEKHNAFESLFFSTRKRIREAEPENWLSLISLYTFANDLRTLIKDHPEYFFLITTRDRSSALYILQDHHLVFLEDNIFGKEEYRIANSKRAIIQGLIDDRQIEESIFIDDLEDHLLACDAMENLISIQARWGYVALEKKSDNSVQIIQEIKNLIQGKNVWT
jgi:phosphoglycolate phosphatase-like HAD superfamily hydrolase